MAPALHRYGSQVKITESSTPVSEKRDPSPRVKWRHSFHLPAENEAIEPPEARGLMRDQVRLMVSYRSDHRIVHTRFNRLADFLERGDLLVVNTSATMKAAIKIMRSDGLPLELHLSTRLPADLWLVELRRPGEKGSQPFFDAIPGERLTMPGGGYLTLLTPYRTEQRPLNGEKTQVRLWIAWAHFPLPAEEYLERFGSPIRYGYVHQNWSISYYQNIYAREAGSAEMPSAGRPFTQELLDELAGKGVGLGSLVLHTGVSSLEEHEPPYEEYFRVPAETAIAINQARQEGRRVIAVGTTVVRALETVTSEDLTVHPGEGWTGLVITPDRKLRAVNSLITGLHEPRATHLAMLEALAGKKHIRLAYSQALQNGYLWHEFGDMHLLLP